MGTVQQQSIKHPVPHQVKPSFVIFDIWVLMTLRAEHQRAQMSKITNGLAQNAL